MRLGINTMLLWGDFSGVEVAIDRLVSALAEVDSENDYALYVPRDVAGGCPRRSNWSVHRAPVDARSRLARIAWEQGKLPRLAQTDRLDVLHAPGYVLPLRCRVPMVLSVYDLFALTRPALSRRANVLHYRLMVPPSVCRATRVIVPSDHVRAQLVARLNVPEAKVRVIPLGVDEDFRPVEHPERRRQARRRYRLPPRYLLFVGNLEPKKNLPALLTAYARALPRLPDDIGLVLAGKATWGHEDLAARARGLGIANRVRFLGYVPRTDLPALYSGAEAFVFPSLCEGFGLPALEAMACGTPVVASQTTALAEVTGDAAQQVTPESVESIADGICRVVTDDGRAQKLICRGHARARQFTWRRTAEETLRVYAEAAEARP